MLGSLGDIMVRFTHSLRMGASVKLGMLGPQS